VSDLAKMALLDAGLDPDRDLSLRYFRTKMSCLQAVTLGSAAACAVPNFLLPQLTSLGHMRLRALWETPPINHVVYAVHPRVPEEHRRMLRDCILGWPGTAEGRKVMAVGAWTRFVPASDADYDDVRRYKARLRAMAADRRHAEL
jgi:ABC-type phosphate/phosphonate transport system substrate-binding protein